MIRAYDRPVPMADILEEHIEEAAFLYECRLRLHHDPERSWEELAAYERRMIPHLDALSLAGMASAALLRDRLAPEGEDDAGEAFVAAAVIPTLGRVEPMEWLAKSLSLRTPGSFALADGLRHTLGKDIEGWLEHLLGDGDPAVRSVCADVIGYRGITRLAEKLLPLRDDADPDVSLAATEALASMEVAPSRDALLPFLDDPDPSRALRAIEMLLRLGETGIVSAVRERCAAAAPETNRRLVALLAISGDRGDLKVIADRLGRQPKIRAECLFALGLWGYPEAAEVLLAAMESADDAGSFRAACDGLRSLTGADLLSSFDFEEAEPDSLAGYRNLWREWWNANGTAFTGEHKWRRGRKLSPTALMEDLLRPGNPCRDLTYLEMAIRYGCGAPFRHDQFHDIQAGQLQGIRIWSSRENVRFQAGLPYFHGELPG